MDLWVAKDCRTKEPRPSAAADLKKHFPNANSCSPGAAMLLREEVKRFLMQVRVGRQCDD
jgi:hypothetical protein